MIRAWGVQHMLINSNQHRNIILIAAVAATAVCMMCLAIDAAHAQGPFGVGGAAAFAPAAHDGVFGWVLAKQAAYYRDFSGMIRASKANGTAVYGLLGLSFTYGIFHAAGPGHGKAVISSYLIANGETWRRGVALSFASALLQALAAVAIVGIFAAILGQTAATMTQAARAIEMASYCLIVAVGARSAHMTRSIIAIAPPTVRPWSRSADTFRPRRVAPRPRGDPRRWPAAMLGRHSGPGFRTGPGTVLARDRVNICHGHRNRDHGRLNCDLRGRRRFDREKARQLPRRRRWTGLARARVWRLACRCRVRLAVADGLHGHRAAVRRLSERNKKPARTASRRSMAGIARSANVML